MRDGLHADTMMTLVLAPTIQRADVVIYTSPGGNEDWSGRFAQPNAQKTDVRRHPRTGRRDIMRQAISTAAPHSTFRVIVGDGRYQLTKPFV